METGGCWRFDMPEEVQKRTVERGRAVDNLISINLLEVIATVLTSYVRIDMKGYRRRKGISYDEGG